MLAALQDNETFYQIAAEVSLVGITLFVLVKQAITTTSLPQSASARAGCGYVYMANKGGVAVRLTVARETYTFVCAHLAAHQGRTTARNADYRALVERLIFTSHSGVSTIYETDHLFVYVYSPPDMPYLIRGSQLRRSQLPHRPERTRSRFGKPDFETVYCFARA